MIGSVVKDKRYVGMRLLEGCTVLLVHVHHSLWRLANRADGSGFTDKEQAYLKKRLATVDQVVKDLQRFRDHVKKAT